MKKRTKLIAAGLLSIAALAGVYLGGIQLVGNFAEVIPGELYRSAQPSPDALKKYARDYGIKTVVNLRGGRPGEARYDAEAKAASEAGMTFVNYEMSAKQRLDRDQAAELLTIFETAEKPVLIHCKSGSDRTGLAAALYMGVYKKKDEELAESQISLRYGHIGAFGLSGTYAMDDTWEDVEWWYDIENQD